MFAHIDGIVAEKNSDSIVPISTSIHLWRLLDGLTMMRVSLARARRRTHSISGAR